jgi:hypothetical protein
MFRRLLDQAETTSKLLSRELCAVRMLSPLWLLELMPFELPTVPTRKLFQPHQQLMF